MKLDKRFGIATLTAALLLLTGCNKYGTDIPEEYKAYFDYTFNGNYDIVLDEEGIINEGTDHEQGYRHWSVTYTDKHGTEHTAKLTGAELIDEDKDSFKTQEWFDVFETHAFVTSQLRTIGEKELWDEILSDHLDVEYAQGNVTHNGEECTLSMMIAPVAYSYNEAGYAYAKEKLSHENGHHIADCDLTSLLQDDEFVLMLIIRLEHDADGALYQEKITRIEQELLKYTGGAQNYSLVLRQQDEEESDSYATLYEHIVFLGEDFVPDASVENDSIAKAVLRNWQARYQ